MKSYPFVLITACVLFFTACKNNKQKEFELEINNIQVSISPTVFKGENTALLEIPLNMEEVAHKESINYKVIYSAYLTSIQISTSNPRWFTRIENIEFELYNNIRKPLKIAYLNGIEQQISNANVIKNNDLGDFFQDNSLFLLTNIQSKEAESASFEMSINLKFKIISEKQQKI